VIMVSMKIVSNIELFVNWGAASALGVVLLTLTVLVLWIASRFLNLENIAGGGH
jgi:ABC-type spermidine/putrescine transport system permease subunit I